MKKLLKIIDQNCKLSNEQVAVMSGTTEEEVAKSLATLEADGTIRGYKAIIDWDNTDVEYVSAIIELKVIPKRDRGFDEVAAKVCDFPEVKSMYLMSGGYDLFLNITGKTFKEIAFFVAKKLAPIDAVQSTATHFVLKRYKDEGFSFMDEKIDERGITSP